MPKLKVYDTSRKITTQRTLAFAKGVLKALTMAIRSFNFIHILVMFII